MCLDDAHCSMYTTQNIPSKSNKLIGELTTLQNSLFSSSKTLIQVTALLFNVNTYTRAKSTDEKLGLQLCYLL